MSGHRASPRSGVARRRRSHRPEGSRTFGRPEFRCHKCRGTGVYSPRSGAADVECELCDGEGITRG